jgi:competence protein ComEA
VVLVCAALVFGVRVAWARAESQPVPIPAAVTSTATQRSGLESLAPFPTSALGPDPTSGVRGQVMVHVVGQVRRPGVVALPTGSRVADAVTAAGGALPRADLTVLNLARLLVDGEQIRVPRPGESVTPTPGTSAGSGAAPQGAPVNLNTADLATLDTLPGVGPVLAQRILDWRAEHGRFSTVEELGEVSGIGEKLLAQLAPRVTV